MSPDALVAVAALLCSLLATFIGLTWKASSRLARIEHQLYPDHGQSLRDRVDLLERKLDLLVLQAEDNREAVRRVWTRLETLTDTPRK
jgi:hypothetical protein